MDLTVGEIIVGNSTDGTHSHGFKCQLGSLCCGDCGLGNGNGCCAELFYFTINDNFDTLNE